MLHTDELLDQLGMAHFCSTLVLTNKYWQISLIPMSQAKKGLHLCSVYTNISNLHLIRFDLQ